MVGISCLVAAFIVPIAANSFSAQREKEFQKELATLIATQATGKYEVPDSPVGGLHKETFELTQKGANFDYHFHDSTTEFELDETATVNWLNVAGARISSKPGFKRYDCEVLLVKPIPYKQVVKFETLEVKFETVSHFYIGFNNASLARRCAQLIRAISGYRRDVAEHQYIDIEVNCNLIPMKIDRPRMINGQAYARVCSLSAAMGIKMMNNEDEEIWIDRGAERFRMPIGEYTLYAGDKPEPAPLPALHVGDRVFFPVKFVVQRLGGHVSWNPFSRMLSVTMP